MFYIWEAQRFDVPPSLKLTYSACGWDSGSSDTLLSSSVRPPFCTLSAPTLPPDPERAKATAQEPTAQVPPPPSSLACESLEER